MNEERAKFTSDLYFFLLYFHFLHSFLSVNIYGSVTLMRMEKFALNYKQWLIQQTKVYGLFQFLPNPLIILLYAIEIVILCLPKHMR